LRGSDGSRGLVSKGCACGSDPLGRQTLPSSGNRLRAAAVIDGYESRDLKQQRRVRGGEAARAAPLAITELATPGLLKPGLVRARGCLGTGHPALLDRREQTLLVHAREPRLPAAPRGSWTLGDRDGGFGRPALYLLGEMPEELAQRVGAADGHVAGTDRWHEVAVTNPMFFLKLGTPGGEGTRPSSVGSVPGRGQAPRRRLSEPDGSDRKRQKDTSWLAHKARAQAPVPGGARAPR
jgi:hypothetical protein